MFANVSNWTTNKSIPSINGLDWDGPVSMDEELTMSLLLLLITLWAVHEEYGTLCDRLVPVVLLKLPTVLWSNAPKFCLFYAPYVKHYALQIQHFISLTYSISWVLAVFLVPLQFKHMINNSFTYVYKHFEFIVVAFATLVNVHILTKFLPQIHQVPWKVHVYYIQILHVNCAGSICQLCWHCAQCFCHPIMLKIICWHNEFKPIVWNSYSKSI